MTITTSSTVPDGRRHPRFEVQLEAQVQLGGHTIPALTKDVSRGGICIVCARDASPGTVIRLRLALALGNGAFSEQLELSARVIWCTAVDGRHQLGAVFTELTPEKRGFLEMFLRFLQQEILVGEGEAQGPADLFDTGGEDEP
jgi:hypothetical protein